MNVTIKSIVVLMILTVGNGCGGDDDNCISDVVVPADTVEVSVNSGLVNELVNFTVNFTVMNGCGAFNKFIETRQGNVITVAVEARFTGCICTMALQELSADYSFIANTPGDYELRFSSGNNQFISVLLTIN